MERRQRRTSPETNRRAELRELGRALQAAESEGEALALLHRTVLRALPPGGVAVLLSRDAGGDHLDAAPTVPNAKLRDALADAMPQRCLAIRLARTHLQSPRREPILACDLCRATGMHTACVPAVAAGVAVAALQLATPLPTDARFAAHVEDVVEQAAPVLGSLRMRALAARRAQIDALTGLPNRRHAVDALQRMAAQALRAAATLGAVRLDIDRLERLNDALGRDVGDAALAAVADTLRSRLRTSDFCARWDGEEFLLLLPHTPRVGAAAVAEEIRVAVARLRVGERRTKLTASLGVAEFPTDATDPAGLMRVVEQALHTAKETGRDRVVVAPPPDVRRLLE